eukprot:CAMPEP_0195281962 /NCGR_PEP_ID=MMETSP0707-20130614/1053_1 /TAXON_ID=33640 /ORGANISM="Asterionellopsis glacialis, Strain CCMP134" /LENGTH=323 /DNA_ID=CAMNT_0040340905 /DNA_START=60 /DNA_END=1031 /DNA_ORIENTATION=-
MRIKYFSTSPTAVVETSPVLQESHKNKNKTSTSHNHTRGYQSEDDMVLKLKNRRRNTATGKKKSRKTTSASTKKTSSTSTKPVPQSIQIAQDPPSTTTTSTTSASTESSPFIDSLIVKLWNPDSAARDTHGVMVKLKVCVDGGGVEGLLNICEKGGLSAILQAMKRHLDCPKIQELSCRILRLFAKQKETRFTLAKTSNSISTLINVINYHMKNQAVVMWAESTLSNLSLTAYATNLISSGGGIKSCVRALETHTEDANIQKLSVSILYSLSLSKVEMEEIRKINPKNALKAASNNFPKECGKKCTAILFRMEPETESDVNSL